jgi:hypothetical protein
MPAEHRSVAALEVWCRRGPCPAARGEFVVADVQMDAAPGDVDLDPVAVAHQRQRPADVAFRGHVQYHSPVTGSAHPGIGDAQYVTRTCRQYGTDPEEREDAIRARAASLMALSPRKYPNVIQAGSRLLASASPDAYYQLGVDMLVAGLIGVATRAGPN